MSWSKQAPICWGIVLCLLLYLRLPGRAGAQGETPRPSRRSAPSPATLGNAAAAPAKTPQALSSDTRIALDQSGLSVVLQDQDLPAIIERIANLGQIELRYLEGIPKRRGSLRFSSLSIMD